MSPILILAAFAALALLILWPERGLLARWHRVRRAGERTRIEDALKHIHAREGRGNLATAESIAGKLGLSVRAALGLMSSMEEGGLVQATGSGLRLTVSGRKLALRVIRAHRLLERYMADELGMSLREIHAAADRREHAISAEEVDALEAQLGYPQHDPHGDPIPSSSGSLEAQPATALVDWPLGQPARIVHLEDEPPEALDQIVAAGLAPGMQVEVQRVGKRELILWDGERERTLPALVATNVFVTSLSHPVEPPARLSSLQPGESGRIVALRCEGLERRRLLDLGFTPGAVVECAHPGPMGEPVAYRVRGALVALRREQGDHIEIEPLSPTGNGEAP